MELLDLNDDEKVAGFFRDPWNASIWVILLTSFFCVDRKQESSVFSAVDRRGILPGVEQWHNEHKKALVRFDHSSSTR